MFASRLVLKMEIPATGVYMSLALGRRAQRRHRVGLAERKVSAWPERSSPELQGDRSRMLDCVGPVTVKAHSINLSGLGSQWYFSAGEAVCQPSGVRQSSQRQGHGLNHLFRPYLPRMEGEKTTSD